MGASVVKGYAFLPPPATYGADFVNTWIERSPRDGGGRIPAVHVAAPSDRRRSRAPLTVLYTHGNAEDIGQMREWMTHLSQRCGVDVLFYDYPGYGLNPGPCSESGCLRDVELCFRFLTETRGIDPRRVVLMGRSLGSGPTVHLASKLSKRRAAFGGMVVQSGVASCVRVVSNALAYVPFTDIFCNVDKIGSVTQPTFIIHGRADGVVPFHHGEMLFEKLRPAAKWRMLALDGADHNDIEQLYYDELMTSLIDFFDMVEDRAAATA